MLVDEGMASLLATTVTSVSVSLDGACSKTHEALRGVRGAFRRALRGVETLVEHGVHPELIFAVHRGNVHELEGVVRLGAAMGARGLKVNYITSMGRAAEMGAKDELLTLDEVAHLRRVAGPELSERYGIAVLVDVPCSLDTLKRVGETGIGCCPFLGLLSILGGGEICWCGFGYARGDWVMGNILQGDSIRQVWEHHPLLTHARQHIPQDITGVCGACAFLKRCVGKCRALAMQAYGDLLAPDPICQELYNRGAFPVTRLIREPEPYDAEFRRDG
jgi:radical SAM protein with 4Fe4S-binding SPASM domain